MKGYLCREKYPKKTIQVVVGAKRGSCINSEEEEGWRGKQQYTTSITGGWSGK